MPDGSVTISGIGLVSALGAVDKSGSVGISGVSRILVSVFYLNFIEDLSRDLSESITPRFMLTPIYADEMRDDLIDDIIIHGDVGLRLTDDLFRDLGDDFYFTGDQVLLFSDDLELED